MRIIRIYQPDSFTTQTMLLSKEASHHLINVLRVKLHTLIYLFDGQGNEFKATVSNIEKKHVTVTLNERHEKQTESPLRIHLAQALTSNDKMDWVIQKSVELGVTDITPILTEFGNTKLVTHRIEKKMTHWQKVIISACEQSGRTVLPTIHAPAPLSTFIHTNPLTTALFCSPRATTTIQKLPTPQKEVTLFVGPEGGFSEKEVELMENHRLQG